MSTHLTYPEAIVIGALQGVTELFPISSLGHAVLLPALAGGRWAADLSVSAPESPYLAFLVGLHVATALALLVFFWRDWVRVVGGFLSSLRHRRVGTPDERLAWMIVLATIPVGVTGLALEHTFRTVLGRPVPAAVFLMVNGLVLLAAERLRRRGAARVPSAAPSGQPVAQVGAVGPASAAGAPVFVRPVEPADRPAPAHPAEPDAPDVAADARIARRGFLATTLIGAAQVFALLPGISRSGVTMAAGLSGGLSHEDSARFAFLLATPVILAAGLLKIPDLFGPLGAGIHGQVLAGSLAAGVCAYLSVRFLTRYFQTRTLTPFAVYCVLAGAGALAVLGLR